MAFLCSEGGPPVPAALRPLGPLPRPSPAGVSGLPAAAGLRVAAVASVPAGAGLLRGAAAEAGRRGLLLRLRHLPVQQPSGEAGLHGQTRNPTSTDQVWLLSLTIFSSSLADALWE